MERGCPKNKWPSPKVGGGVRASEFLEADELNPIPRHKYTLSDLLAAGLSDWAKVNTENRDQKEDQVGSSTALSNHQEKQQGGHQSWDLNQQSKGREPRTQGQYMAAPKRHS